jgi:retron-type reverse transcriptase
MKRAGSLWPQIVDFENLLYANKRARKSKRFYPNILDFNDNLESELLQLQQELITDNYQPGNYRTFQIFEPKPRLISAAPYRDRVVHHALCQIINPIFEKSLIYDCYANRVGFGSHRALRRFTQFTRSHRYILQCDIKKYFPSIDHQILKTILARKIKCVKTLNLIYKIIDNSNIQEPSFDYFPNDNLFTPWERRKGLPIGNLTSQIFANIYLNYFDHFMQEELKVGAYLRYVDDFAIFSNDREFLVNIRERLENYLVDLRLKIHPIKSQIFATRHGANFVGFRVFPDNIRIRNDNLRRARIRLKKLQKVYFFHHISLKKLIERLRAWEAHLNYANSYKLRQNIFNYYGFHRYSVKISHC